VPPEDGDRIQSPKRCGFFRKKKTMDNVQLQKSFIFLNTFLFEILVDRLYLRNRDANENILLKRKVGRYITKMSLNFAFHCHDNKDHLIDTHEDMTIYTNCICRWYFCQCQLN
jgi:hypothetical protein